MWDRVCEREQIENLHIQLDVEFSLIIKINTNVDTIVRCVVFDKDTLMQHWVIQICIVPYINQVR